MQRRFTFFHHVSLSFPDLTNNEALEALLQKFAPLIKKCGRQLHIEDGNEEMILAFIELVKDFSPSNLRNIDDGTVVQYIKQSMYHYCFRIYKKYHHVETVIGWDEISPKEEAEYLATQDKIQLNDGLLTELQIDVLTKREISSNYYYIFSKINESDILENELKME